MAPVRSLCATAFLILVAAAIAARGGLGATWNRTWRVAGELSEACTCRVPCPCNFGELPSPYPYCHAVYSLRINHGHYQGVRLDGLHLAGAFAAQGTLLYVDDRGTVQQRRALESMGRYIIARLAENARHGPDKGEDEPEVHLRDVRVVSIEQQIGSSGVSVRIGQAGQFEGDYLVGIDGKTPIVMENNWSWNIQHAYRGKTLVFHYSDDFGNFIDTNINQGRFDWNDKTRVYFR